MLLLMLLVADAVACRRYHLQKDGPSDFHAHMKSRTDIDHVCQLPNIIAQHHVETILHFVRRAFNLHVNRRTFKDLVMSYFIEQHHAMKYLIITPLQFFNRTITIPQLSNLHISTPKTFGFLSIDNHILDFVRFCVRFGPAIISELDGTLLGRTSRDLLRKSLGCDSLR